MKNSEENINSVERGSGLPEQKKKSWMTRIIPPGIPRLLIVGALFYYLGHVMGVPNMLNTIMHTAHDLLLNTVFYLMGICVITGA